MRRIILVIVFMLSAIATQAQEKVNWISFEEAVAASEKSPKPILVDLYTDWCGWCKKMDRDTYANDIIANYINENYYAVKLDGEAKEDIAYQGKTFKLIQQGRSKYHELAYAILKGKLSYPSTAFFDKNQKLVQALPGYHKKEDFEVILAFFGEESYGTIPWKEFQEKHESSF